MSFRSPVLCDFQACPGIRTIIADSFHDFDGVQQHPDASGQGQWQYGEISGGTFSSTGWCYIATGWWSNSNYRIVSAGGLHPYLNSSKLVTRRWTSGEAGELIIEGGIRRGDESGSSDGIIATIVLNGTNTIYSATLNGTTNLNGIGDAYDCNSRLFTLTNTIAVGDTLDLTINPRGNNNYDSTDFTITISKEFNGPVFSTR